MVHEVSFEGFTTQSAPWKLEAGTPNVAGVIGLSAALEWLTDYDINQAESWSRSLATLAEEALAKRPGFRSFRCQDSSLLAFDFAGVHHSDMVTLLAEYGIAPARRAALRSAATGRIRRNRHTARLICAI